MAGMFYSLKETAEKLGRTEDQVRDFVKQGKLREFRDGSNLLFKVDEVESLLPMVAAKTAGEPPAPEEPVPTEQGSQAGQISEDEISLASETGLSAAGSGLTEADTAITAEGISVLGETDKDYPVTEDMMAETVDASGILGATGTVASEASLEEIEEDVNLDSFGSGSGLLDLSLQADDTSLGGILDEIYTAEGEGAEPAKPAEPGSVGGLTAAEVEEMLPEEEVAPQPIPETAVMAQPYAEPGPDVQSDILGKLLILPFVFLLYTAIVAILGQRDVVPSLLTSIQGVIWYVVIAAVVVAGLVVGAAFMLTGDFAKAAKKPAKPKKEKKPKKPKKAKKSK
jgi:hypothetical protein